MRIWCCHFFLNLISGPNLLPEVRSNRNIHLIVSSVVHFQPQKCCATCWVGDFVCQTGTSTRIGESKKGIYLYFLGSPVSKSTLAGWWWLETWIFFVHISVISSSQLTNSYFSEGLLYHQPVIIQYFQIYNPLHQKKKNNSNGMISYFAGSSTTKQSPNFHGISLGQRKKRTAFCSILVHVGELTHLWNIIILIGKSTLNGGAMLVYQPVKYVSWIVRMYNRCHCGIRLVKVAWYVPLS